jgi:tungstate transport system ATP-binding protein
MGIVFQNTVLFDGNVYKNVAYGIKLRKVKKNEIRPKIMKALDTVGLAHLEKRHINTLSGGEAQRVAIARVLVYEPEILLLDEPTANLDPANTANIESAIRRARDTYGTTVILATHNMYQAKRLGDRIAVLLDGQFIEVGDRDTIFDHPKQELTRKFTNGEIIY